MSRTVNYMTIRSLAKVDINLLGLAIEYPTRYALKIIMIQP